MNSMISIREVRIEDLRSDGTDYNKVPQENEKFEFTHVPSGVKAIEGMKPGYRIIFCGISPLKTSWPWKKCDFVCADNGHYVGFDTYHLNLWLKHGVLKWVA